MSDANNPLVRTISEFREFAPRVTINLMIGTPSEVERGVIDGRLHIGILPDYQRHPSLHYDDLYDEFVGLFCGGPHPIAQLIARGTAPTETEVYAHSLVYRGYFESDLLRSRKQRFPVGSTVYQTEAVLALVQSGVSLGFFPTHCLNMLQGRNYEILPDIFRYSTKIHAITRSDRQQSTICTSS